MYSYITKGGLVALYLTMTSPAFAYLDGATGSMLLQAAIGGFATAMVFGRTYLAKAKAFIFRKSTNPQNSVEVE